MEFKLDANLFPEWNLVSLIGEGSFGKVYLIKKQLLDGEIFSALKVITIPQSSSQIRTEKANGMSDEEIHDYFKSIVEDWHKEIILLNSLKGITNVVNIEDYKIIEAKDEIRWDIYIRMEYVDNFNDIIAKEAITDAEALKLGMDLCQALVYCQRRKIVHRDIKPENIFRSQFGDYKLGDFGIARQIEKTNSSLSKKGTYLYMAPEVYNGKTYDARADIYSLGLVLYRMFNGNQIPFIAPNVTSVKFSDKENSIQRRMDGELIPHPGLANDKIAAVILKACAPNPENRYSTAVELFNDLYALHAAIKEPTVVLDISKKRSSENNGTVKTEKDELSTPDDTQKTSGVFITPIPVKTTPEPTEKTEGLQYAQPDNPVPDSDTDALPVEEEISSIPIQEKPVPPVNIKQKANKETKKKKPILAYVAGLAALVVVLVVASIIAMNNQPKEGMPDLVGISVFRLSNAIEKEDFDLEYRYVNSTDKSPGTIIDQSVNPGTNLNGKTKLTLQVAIDSTYAIIPNLVGKSHEEVQSTLDGLGVGGNFIEVSDDTKTAGTVISQSVEPNFLLKKGTLITLQVVAAPVAQKVTLPNGVGLTLSEYTADLTNLGLESTHKEEFSSTVAAGKIISHDPASGSQVDKGSSVTITVSKGKAPAETVKVPNGVGLTLTNYETALTNAGLVFTVKEEFSNTVANGVVISHSPAKDTTVNVGSSVTITVSKGKASAETVKVPNGVGSTLTNYKTALTNAGLVFTVKEEFSDTVANGVVISHSPAKDTTVNVGSSVTITVSKGKAVTTVKVPNGVGSTLTNYKTALTNAGLVFTVIDQFSDTVASGVVISHSPVKDTTVNVGSSVTITVSKGKATPTSVTVPDGTGKTIDAYKATLTGLGLKFTVTEQNHNTIALGTVISHIPAKDAKVDPGSTIAITVSKGEYPWSDWVTALPTGVTADKYEIDGPKDQYGYSTIQWKDGTSPTMAGWTLHSSKVTGYDTSKATAWQRTQLYETDTMKLETRTVYRYYRLYWPVQPVQGVNYSFKRYSSWVTPKYYEEILLLSALTATNTYADYRAYSIPYNSSLTMHRYNGAYNSPYIGTFIGSYVWTDATVSTTGCTTCWYQEKIKDGVSNTFTEYRHVPKIYTYTFFKYDPPTSWSFTRVTPGVDQKEFIRQVYKYRLK